MTTAESPVSSSADANAVLDTSEAVPREPGRSSRRGTLAKAWVLADGVRRRSMAVLVGLSIFGSALETLGAALIVVVLGLATGNGEIRLPVVGDVSGYVPGGSNDAKTVWAAAMLAAFFVVRGVVMVVQTYVQQRILWRAGARLSATMLNGYLHESYAFHLRRKTSELTRNAFNGVQVLVGSVMIPMVTLVTDLLATVVLLAFMLAMSPGATLLALGILGPVILLMLRVLQPRLRRLGQISQDEAKQTLHQLQQTLVGIREIKLHGNEPFFVRMFARTRMRAARAQYVKGATLVLPRTIIETSLVLLLLVLVAVTALTGGGDAGPVPVVGLFAYVGFRLQPSLQRIVLSLNNFRFAAPAVDHLYDDYVTMDHAPDLRSQRRAIEEPVGRLESLHVDSVWFSYGDDDRHAVRGIDLGLRRGESIGICGRSGSGKSTLVDIVCGLLAPTQGHVEAVVDGVRSDIADDLKSWYSHVGLVSQSVTMFDGSIRSNIAFGVPPDEVDEDRISEVVELAQLGPMLAAHPQGLDAEVGERGLAVSGGQRQRIAIARALYLRPELIVFDEGTSALDNETEAALVRAIAELREDRLIIMVAHRLSTVQRCDRIVYLSHGTVTAEGTYDELLAGHEEFRSMVAQGGH
ncbi:ABC transporter ATP-binding protein [Nocardioides sp. GXQ0305]|uniref:ABC transporter ATP-binding protein n=1 Tax=Nocardioides sp. GXQ0305 TaxID=3423912 RepID=UPI003D7E62F5